MFKFFMTNKGFADTSANIETPNDMGIAEKPLKSKTVTSNRVDTVSYTHLTLPTKA